ncbi:MAG TPA: serine hydrolase [Novosphingobium capsulatum]|nr:serine hydrolase [Novosphingobium capsulatum]
MVGIQFKRKWRLAVAVMAAFPALAASSPAVQGRPPANLQSPRDLATQQKVASIIAAARGRVGVAAMDLDGGGQVLINGDMPFPMASTAKVAVASTFLQMVEQGRYRLDQPLPMMMPVPEPAGRHNLVAMVRPGPVFTAQTLIERSITRSDNHATDGLIAAVGGIGAVNRFLVQAGISGQHLDHTMATLVRDDGRINPARVIDSGTTSTPRAMIALLSAVDRGGALGPQARAVLLDTMTRTSTGRNRIRAGLPAGVVLAHKTGTLSGVTDDVGIVRLPDGRHLAMAIFVAGPENHTVQAGMIARIASALYQGFLPPLENGALAGEIARRR